MLDVFLWQCEVEMDSIGERLDWAAINSLQFLDSCCDASSEATNSGSKYHGLTNLCLKKDFASSFWISYIYIYNIKWVTSWSLDHGKQPIYSLPSLFEMLLLPHSRLNIIMVLNTRSGWSQAEPPELLYQECSCFVWLPVYSMHNISTTSWLGDY